MNHQTFLSNYLGTFYREPFIPTWECVALSKLFAREVQGFTLPSFGGSARQGWLGNTFDERYWKRVKNTPKNFPKQGDHVFFDIWPYWHVAVCNTANVNNMTVVEQNRTGMPWDAPWDEISIGTYDYSKCYGWFTPIFKLPQEEVPISVVESISVPIWVCPDLPKNTHKITPNYNQKIDWHCTIFACFTAMAYNIGLVFKNLRVQNTAKKYCNPACNMLEATNILKKEFNLKSCVLRDEEAEKALSLGYALVITIIAPSELIVDGIRDWVIDWEYTKDISKSHALCLIKEKDYYLINSLWDYTKKGFYNQYKISKEQLWKILKSQNKYLLYK